MLKNHSLKNARKKGRSYESLYGSAKSATLKFTKPIIAGNSLFKPGLHMRFKPGYHLS